MVRMVPALILARSNLEFSLVAGVEILNQLFACSAAPPSRLGFEVSGLEV